VKLVAAQPEKADRVIAREAKVDHKQVSRARRKAEATGAVAPVEKRTGADGKARKRPTKKKAQHTRNDVGMERKDVEQDDKTIEQMSDEERWQNSLECLCGEIIACAPYWDKHFPGWKKFEYPSHVKTLVKEAATAFASIAKIAGLSTPINPGTFISRAYQAVEDAGDAETIQPGSTEWSMAIKAADAAAAAWTEAAETLRKRKELCCR
jgi:hypothetical protein